MKISKLEVSEILDSRGWPTLQGTLYLNDGRTVMASVPSGRSVGTYEAVELRDTPSKSWLPRGVIGACELFKKEISPLLLNQEINFAMIDRALIACDGTRDKSRLGANTTLLASMLAVRAEALVSGVEPFVQIATITKRNPLMPQIRANIINGGVHADNSLACQEIMIQLRHQAPYEQQAQIISRIYHALRNVMQKRGLRVNVGDEGGFAPIFRRSKKPFYVEKQALDLLTEAVDLAGCQAHVVFCLDVAASEFYSKECQCYEVAGERLSAIDVISLYKELIKTYPIVSIEDGLSQDDWDGWKSLTDSLGKTIELVGDDLFVTQIDRLKVGLKRGAANSLLVKPNQVGTLTEAFDAAAYARQHSFTIVPSHRSGETNDSLIADIAVGLGAEACKIGAPARGERVAKYNRLAVISAQLR